MEANCNTTAMGIMPHTDVERALELALGLDIPFWPQLPNLSFHEDMYAQTAVNFPGISIDVANQRVSFDSARFEEELLPYSEAMASGHAFALKEEYSLTLHRFLEQDLSRYHAIRGQVTGPISFGFRVVDENAKPIIYNDAVRAILYDFIQRKVNAQYHELSKRNKNAFLWLDEPGLGWVFSGMTGYNDEEAMRDYHRFLEGISGPRALHLCANVVLTYLLELGVDILSFDAYQMETMPKGYAAAIARFLREGKIISWGIVPTDSTSLEVETPLSLAARLSGYWERIAEHSDITPREIALKSLIAPARCCLKNIGRVGSIDDVAEQCTTVSSTIEERLVEKAFGYLGVVSEVLKEKYRLPA